MSLVNMSASRSAARSAPWPASACGSMGASRSARSVSVPTTAAKAMRRFVFCGSSASFARRAPRRSCTSSRTTSRPSPFISGLDLRRARPSASPSCRAHPRLTPGQGSRPGPLRPKPGRLRARGRPSRFARAR